MFSVHVGHEFVCLKFEKYIRNVVLLHLFPTRMVLEGLFGARSFILKDYRMLCTVATSDLLSSYFWQPVAYLVLCQGFNRSLIEGSAE